MAKTTAPQASIPRSAKNRVPTLRHGFLIHDVSRLRRTVFDQRMKPMGVTRSQWWVLTNLSRHEGDELTQSELAKLMEVGKVTVGGLIDRLEVNDLVIRKQDPSDRRSRRISVSPKGKQLVEDMKSIAMDINSASLQGVSEDQLQVLIDVLQIMKKNLSAMENS